MKRKFRPRILSGLPCLAPILWFVVCACRPAQTTSFTLASLPSGTISHQPIYIRADTLPLTSTGNSAPTLAYTSAVTSTIPTYLPLVTTAQVPTETLVLAANYDNNNTAFWLINSDGSGLEQLGYLDDYLICYTEGGQFEAGIFIRLSPDGRYLAFDGCKEKDSLNFGVYIADLTAGIVLGPIQGSGCCGFSWAPDSEELVIPVTANLFLYDLESQTLTPLETSISYDLFPTWSPDGQWIAFLRTVGDWPCCGNSETSLYLIRPNGSGEVRLLDGIKSVFAPPDWSPVWSPDSQWLSVRNTNNEVIIVNSQSGEALNTLVNIGFSGNGMSWSPGSEWLALANMESTGNNVTLVDPVSGQIQNLAIHASGGVSWSPDGSRLRFANTDQGNWEIYTITPAGTGLLNLSNTPDEDEADPIWSRTDRYIAYNCRGGIGVMKADGTQAWCSVLRSLRILTWLPPLAP